MKTPILGSAYVARSVNAADNRLINLYPEAIQEGGKEAAFFNRCPGLRRVTTIGEGPIRGMWSFGGYAYIVSGFELYKVEPDLTATLLGAVGGVGLVSMADNGYQLFIATNPQGYIYNSITNTFAEISDPDFAGAQQVTYLYGLFIFNEPNSQKFWITDYDGSQIDPLEFSFAEISPDLIKGIIANNTELWIFGQNSIEVWYYNANVDFPFAPIQGAYNEIGCAASFSIAKLDNSLFWLGQDPRGNGIVYRSQGYNAVRVSTHAIEYAIQKYSRIDDALAYSYQQDGHSFYVITFPSGNETWVYDVATQMWHQRAAWINGQFYRHESNCMVNFDNRILIGGYENGAVYEYDLDYYSDDGDRQRWLRSWRALPEQANNLNRTAHHQLKLDIEAGPPTSAGIDSYLFFRVRAITNWGGTSLLITDIAIYDQAGGPNIAVGGTPFASAGDASLAFSGTGVWMVPMASGEYIGYEFPTPRQPVQIGIRSSTTNGIRGFAIEASNDGVNYTPVGSGEMPFTAPPYPEIGQPPVLQTAVFGSAGIAIDLLGSLIRSRSFTSYYQDDPVTSNLYSYDTNSLVSTTSDSWPYVYPLYATIFPGPGYPYITTSFTIYNNTQFHVAAVTWLTGGFPFAGTNTMFFNNGAYFTSFNVYCIGSFFIVDNELYILDLSDFTPPGYPGISRYPFVQDTIGVIPPLTYGTHTNYTSSTDINNALVAEGIPSSSNPVAFFNYDKLLDCIWMVGYEGQVTRLDRDLNIISVHPAISANTLPYDTGAGFYGGVCIFGAGYDSEYQIRDYNVESGQPPNLIYTRPAVYGLTPCLSFQNGWGYFSQRLVDLTPPDSTEGLFSITLASQPGELLDPAVMLRWSDDGGHTWSNYHTRTIGTLGQHDRRVIWRRLGMTMKLRDRVYELSGNDPCKIAIMGAELDISGTTS